jgi:hypothetical protein
MSDSITHNNSARDQGFIRRILFYKILLAFLVLSILTITSLNTIRSPAKGDISVFVDAAHNLLNGENIYDTPSHSGLYYLYPPIYAFINIPLTVLPINLVIVFWGILTVALLVWIFLAFFKGLHSNTFFSLPVKTRWSIGFLSVLLNVRFIHHHLAVAQANIIVLFCAVLGLVWIQKQKDFLGGMMLGLSFILKILTVPFAFLFIAKKSLRIVAAMSVGAFLGFFAPMLVTGLNQDVEYHKQWFDKVIIRNAPGNTNWADNSNASPQAQLYRFFSGQPAFTHEGKEYKFTITAIPSSILRVTSWLLMFAVLSLIFIYTHRFQREPKIVSHWGAYALVFTLLPLFSTISEKHHYLLIFPACIYVAYIWYELKLSDKLFRMLVLGSLILTTLTTDALWGRFISEVFTGVGCLAFGVLLLVASIFRAAFCLTKSLVVTPIDAQ